uniref:Uncharacterized protein n=1 Tax=Oryza glumipatula TaxID=40148 RepID=A0A0E0AXF7_9ORYZ
MATLPPSSSSSISASRLTQPSPSSTHGDACREQDAAVAGPGRRGATVAPHPRWGFEANLGSHVDLQLLGCRFVTDCDYSGCEISGDEDSNRRLLLHWSSKHDESNNDCDTSAGSANHLTI